ncbi:hypothetical protein [Anatilimnocola floriformis]|uniref:hypothetical protein n=1 Tax=Anatilimnocola floriformis TaxID=2948575 RepID=UPI0020C4A1BE|nr:hypothetical protein [Anatilimnocola floriformis]
MRHQIAGHPASWLLLVRILVGLLVIGAVAALVGGIIPLGILLLVGTAVLAGVVETHAALVRGQRAWIEVLPAGMKYSDRQGEREIQDYEIVSLAFAITPQYSNGHPNGYLRTCRLWTADERVLELKNKYANGEADPLGSFIQRIAETLKEGFAQALAHGVEVRGEGWRLSNTMLYCGVAGRERPLELAKIAAIQDTEGMLGVWLRDEELPAVKLLPTGRNAWLLADLIEPYMAKMPEENEPPREGLGRIIFRRRASIAVVIALFLIAAALGIAGVIGLSQGVQDAFVFVVLLGVGALLCVLAVHFAFAEMTCHEWGVMQRGLLGRRQLLYRDIESFTYRATRNYVNGAYTGTALYLQFMPRAGCGRKITHSSNVQGNDDDLDRLREGVARIIGAQMHQRLANGETVTWTNNLAFSPAGLLYRPPGFISRGNQVLLPYDKYHGHNLQDGNFYLFEKGKDKSVTSESVGEVNFFPGFYLLLTIAHSDD